MADHSTLQLSWFRRLGARNAFTLFEVALSLILVTVGMISVLMLFPVGIKAQQMARFRLLAAAKAQEIADSFNTSANTQSNMDSEAFNPWDVPTGYRVLSHDIETRTAMSRNGVLPLPTEISRRLDSDNDEIHRIIDEGGYLYYSQPMATTGMEERTVTAAPENQVQKLVFAVSGYAQLNALPILPMKTWPYYMPYPSPPGYSWKRHDCFVPADASTWLSAWGSQVATFEGQGSGGTDDNAGSTDKNIKLVDEAFRYYNFALNGGRPTVRLSGSNVTATGNGPNAANAVIFVQAALAFAALETIPAAFYDPQTAVWPKAQLDSYVNARVAEFRQVPDNKKFRYVQAMRFLSYAATTLTRWYPATETSTTKDAQGNPVSGPGLGTQGGNTGGVPIQANTLTAQDGSVSVSGTSPAVTMTHDKIVYYHEICLRLAMLYSASFPYDWGAPRPIQRAIMTDYPLLEWDVANTDVLSGTLYGETRSVEQWRPIAAQPITNIGRSIMYPDRPVAFYADPTTTTPSPMWGKHQDFTLTKPFIPAERCRQIVFWAVDWQSYEDFETLPSAPIDASKVPFAAPAKKYNGFGAAAGSPLTLAQRMEPGLITWVDHHCYAFRNPEKNLVFVRSVTLPTPLPTGTDVTNTVLATATDPTHGDPLGSVMTCYWDHQFDDRYAVFLGQHGADRNFNKKLDRGPLPSSVHIRALNVGRYNIYDARVNAIIK